MSNAKKQLDVLRRISMSTKAAQIMINNNKYQGLKLTFQFENHNGQMGARKFWQRYIPTLQFYNPNLRFEVTRIKNKQKSIKDVPCTLHVLGEKGKVMHTIEMRNRRDDEIMEQLLNTVEHNKVPEDQIVRI